MNYDDIEQIIKGIHKDAEDAYSAGYEAYHDGDKEHANKYRDKAERLLSIASKLEREYNLPF